MPLTIRCPECEAVLKPRRPVSAGERTRCPKCAAVFTVTPDDDDDDTPRPRSSKRCRSGGGSLPWILGGVGVLVMVGIVLVVVLARGRDARESTDGGLPKPGDGGLGIVVPAPAAPLLTREKVNKLQMGMKKSEVASLFGPGRPVTEQLVQDTYRSITQTDGAPRFDRARAAGARSWERWADGGDVLLVAFGPTKRGDRVVYHICFYSGPEGGTMDPGHFVLPGELESAAERWDQETGVLSDPKWKTGKEARAALLGRWHIQTGTASYEFRPDGTYKWLGIGPYTSTYRFTDPQMLELDTYDPYAKLKGRTIPYRVLVAGDEMYLVHQPDDIRPLPVGPYVRQKAEKK